MMLSVRVQRLRKIVMHPCNLIPASPITCGFPIVGSSPKYYRCWEVRWSNVPGQGWLAQLDAATDDVESNRRSIIDEAQVREPDPAYAVGTPGMQQSFSRLVVREMSQVAENALFQDIWIGAAQQSLTIVVRFDDE